MAYILFAAAIIMMIANLVIIGRTRKNKNTANSRHQKLLGDLKDITLKTMHQEELNFDYSYQLISDTDEGYL